MRRPVERDRGHATWQGIRIVGRGTVIRAAGRAFIARDTGLRIDRVVPPPGRGLGERLIVGQGVVRHLGHMSLGRGGTRASGIVPGGALSTSISRSKVLTTIGALAGGQAGARGVPTASVKLICRTFRRGSRHPGSRGKRPGRWGLLMRGGGHHTDRSSRIQGGRRCWQGNLSTNWCRVSFRGHADTLSRSGRDGGADRGHGQGKGSGSWRCWLGVLPGSSRCWPRLPMCGDGRRACCGWGRSRGRGGDRGRGRSPPPTNGRSSIIGDAVRCG